jgi:hypothetical protein
MANNISAEEVLEQHKKVLGDEFGNLYTSLYNEMSRLYVKWEQFETLYASKPSRISILNQTAPLFFRTVQDLLWEDILLHIARMVDKTNFGKRENLSIRWIPEYVQDKIKKAEITGKVDEAVSLTSFAVDWRNRRIAHRDRLLLTNPTVVPLETATILKVKEAFKSLESVLNWVESTYFNSTVMYNLMSHAGGSLSLLYFLVDGIEEGNNKQKRMENGTATDSDYIPRAV